MLGLFRIATVLPYRCQLGLGRGLGRAIGGYSDYRRHVVRTNLEICFPELSDRQRLDLERRAFESFGIGLLELGIAWWLPDRRIAHLAHVEGKEHLDRALARGKGVLLLCSHVTCLEICGRLMQHQVKTAFSYRTQKNPLLEAVMRRARERWSTGGAPRTNPRSMVRYLRQNQVLWFAPDQDYGREHSVFVPFFGTPAATITTLSRIAGIGGAAVVPFYNRRLESAKGYLLRFEPALEDFPGGDPAADAARVNRILEGWIREDPSQYLWIHRRFKTRPAGQLKFYRPKRGRERRRPGEAGL
jgi:KDO2-lipid IV(A) lauroyltransferase